MKNHYSCWIGLAILSLAPCAAQDSLDKLMQAETGVGTAVAVVFEGKAVYAKAVGLANAETRQPLSLDCVWRSGSVARAYTSMVIALLGREGVLALDKPVGTYWPELNALLGKASVRQLLENRGGVKDEHVDYPLWQVGNLRKYALGFDAASIIAEPGYIRSFSSPSGNLAAAVAEQVAGKDFGELLESRVFRPMEFSRTSLAVLQIVTQPIAQGHHKGADGWEVVRPLAMNIVGWPGNSIFTSVAEGITFLGALADEGRWNGRQVFPKAAVADTIAFLKSGGSGAAVMQDATSWGGVATTFVLSPEKRFAMILFTNGGLSRTASAAIIARAEETWMGTMPGAESPRVPGGRPVAVTEAQAKELAGL